MHDNDYDGHIDGASRQLSAIHAGGQHLIIQTRQRISRALDALDEGDFTGVHEMLMHAAAHISNLATAQQYIAIAEGSRLVLAADLEEGMTLTDVGTVTGIEVQNCPSPKCRRHVRVSIGEHDLHFHGDAEMYVVNS